MTPHVWAGLGACVVGLVLLLHPAARKELLLLNLACGLVFGGIYIHKAMAFVISGFTPSPLGEIYEYTPSLLELRVAAGIFSVGLFVFTILSKIAVGIETGALAFPGSDSPDAASEGASQ